MVFGVYKYGIKIIFTSIDGALTSSLAKYSNYKICTLAEIYRPKFQITNMMWISEGTQGMITIKTNGEIYLQTYDREITSSYSVIIFQEYFIY